MRVRHNGQQEIYPVIVAARGWQVAASSLLTMSLVLQFPINIF